MKIILRAEKLDNKDYVQKLHLEDGKDIVWKGPRPGGQIEVQIREQFNEILSGKIFDDLIDSKLEPHLDALDQKFGTVTNFIDNEWNPTQDITSYTNSNKLNVFFGLEIWFHQQDRGNGATRHLRTQSNCDGTLTICPIDNGFSFMYIDGSKIDPGEDLNPEFLNNLLSAAFVTSESDKNVILGVINSLDINQVVLDVGSHFVTTCSFSPTLRRFIWDYSKQLIYYLESRRPLLEPAFENWLILRNNEPEKVEVPLNAVP